MARKFTIQKLMSRARTRADMTNSDFVTDVELRDLLSASFAHLYELLIQSGLIYFDPKVQTITGDGSETHDLPDDYYGTMRVDYRWSSNYFTELSEYMDAERTRFENAIGGATSGYSTHYQIQGTKISLLPSPRGGTYRHRYIPAPLDLGGEGISTDTEIDGVGGWEEFVVVDTARKMLMKEESSTTQMERELDKIMMRIEEKAQNRSWATPRHIVDVQTRKRETTDWWRYASSG